MSIMNGKKGLIMGVANERSIAWGIAKTLADNGAELAFSYQNESFKKRLIPLMRTLKSNKSFECDYLIVSDGIFSKSKKPSLKSFNLSLHNDKLFKFV